MSKICEELHRVFNSLPKQKFPFDEKKIPKNGIYILFEKGEKGHGFDRIVRIGTHTGDNNLRSRLKQHFLVKNKDRSIFRKNIGRVILNKNKDPYLEKWELCLTSKEAREKYLHIVDLEKQKQLEEEISSYIQKNFQFVVLPIENKDKRLGIESKIISAVSLCKECGPSNRWFGKFSPKDKIRESGLWLVNELGKVALSEKELEEVKRFIK